MHANILMLSRVADALGHLREKVVFVGGATVPLFLTEQGAPTPRSTKDVDVIAQIATRKAYYDLSDELKGCGFAEDGEAQVLCRWKLGELIVDVMPTEPTILGFSNRWYEDVIRTAERYVLDAELAILLVAPPYFIATKIEAFLGRGRGDFLGSSDMEDIVAVLDGRVELVDEIKACDLELREYLGSQFSLWLSDSDFLEALSGHLLPDAASQAREAILLERLRQIANVD